MNIDSLWLSVNSQRDLWWSVVIVALVVVGGGSSGDGIGSSGDCGGNYGGG